MARGLLCGSFFCWRLICRRGREVTDRRGEAAVPLVDLGSYKGPLGLVSVMGVTVKPAGNWMADGEDRKDSHGSLW